MGCLARPEVFAARLPAMAVSERYELTRAQRVPAQIMPTNLPSSKNRRTRCCTGELVEIVSAPFAPPGMTNRSNLSYPHMSSLCSQRNVQEAVHTGVQPCGEKNMSGRMLMPREPRAKGGLLELVSLSTPAETYADAHDTPARTSVS